MSKNFEKIDKILNIESNIIETEVSSPIDPIDLPTTKNLNVSDTSELKKDYEYTRANLYSLIEKGQEAINGIMELAEEGGSPRAYEVAGQLIKNVGDVTDKLIDLQKKLREVDVETTKTTNNVTNNAVFIGSTTELSKLLKKGFLNSKE